MHKYDSAFDPALENDSHAIMVSLVGQGQRVLDVGCATGRMARALVERGCTVSGVEFDPAAAKEARGVLKKLVVGDLNHIDLRESFGKERFDVLVFGDVLEHVLDPDRVLVDTLRLLDQGGTAVISIPNVAHASARLALLQGNWRYTEVGLLDSTHIRFFTPETVLELLDGAGLVVLDYRPTRLDALGTNVSVNVDALPRGVLKWVRSQPHSDVFQVVLRAIRVDDPRVTPELLATSARLRASVKGPGPSPAGSTAGRRGSGGLARRAYRAARGIAGRAKRAIRRK